MSLAEVRYGCINNDHQSALNIHISFIATNNHQCFEKFVRETISFSTEDLSELRESEQSFYRRKKGIGGATSGWTRKGSPAGI